MSTDDLTPAQRIHVAAAEEQLRAITDQEERDALDGDLADLRL